MGSVEQERKYNMRLQEVRRGVDTYWMNESLRFATTHKHNLFLEGGDGVMRYGVGVSYGKTQGVMKGSDRDVLNGNVRLIYRKGRVAFTNSLMWIIPGQNGRAFLLKDSPKPIRITGKRTKTENL